MLAFTICSNNYIAQAKVLGTSWRTQHPYSPFIIGLVDRRIDGWDYGESDGTVVVPVEDISVPGLEELARKYNIIELNTAAKPFYFHYLHQRFGENILFYFDPDIQIFSPITLAENLIVDADCVVTPHICSPIWDSSCSPNDYTLLTTGIFNLGFIGVRYTLGVQKFIAWWRSMVAIYGYRSQHCGLFYDQIWCNYLVCFLDKVAIIRNCGYNVANWNLHERTITPGGPAPFVNRTDPLVFFHFSHFSPLTPHVLAKYNRRYTLGKRPDVRPLVETYRTAVDAAGFQSVHKVPCYFERFFGLNRGIVPRLLGRLLGGYYRKRDRRIVVNERSDFARRIIDSEKARFNMVWELNKEM